MENNTDTRHYFCLILAGGKGRRLWPVSREDNPKQFIDFFGTGKSLLQMTYDRFAAIIPRENIMVSTYTEYKDKVITQLPDLDPNNLLCEPIRRNTAPIVAWALHHVGCIDPDASIIISPSDQIVTGEAAFRDDVISCLRHVTIDGCFLTMGIRPKRPEPGYGYIQLGDPSTTGTAAGDDATGSGFYHVQSFTEKPARVFAEMFMKSGEFLWNTGLYVSKIDTLRNRLEALLPVVMRTLDNRNGDASWRNERSWVREHYSSYPNLSLESGILERCRGVCVKECNFGWTDMGAWHGIYEALTTSSLENVTLNTDSMLSDTTGCVISLPEGRKAVINGLHDFIVAERGNILLITPRSDSSSQVVKLMNRYYNE